MRSKGLLSRARENRSFLRSLVISFANQGLTSGTTFALGLYLIGALSPNDFGTYNIAFYFSLFLVGCANAVLYLQMTVHAPEKPPHERSLYVARFLVAALFTALGLQALSAVIFLSLLPTSWASHGGLVLSIGAFTASTLVQAFFLRHSYNSKREEWAFAINLVFLVVLVVTIAVLRFLRINLDVSRVLLLSSAGNLLSSVLGLRLMKLPIRESLRAEDFRRDLREAWGGGRWSLASNCVLHLRVQAHTLICGAMIGAVGVAQLNVGRFFVSPIVIVMPAVSQVLVPRMAEMRLEAPKRALRMGRLLTIFLASIALIYAAVMLAMHRSILGWTSNNTYQALSPIVTVWLLYGCLLSVSNGQYATLLSFKAFRMHMNSSVIATAVALVVGFGLTWRLGPIGAVLGMASGELVFAALLSANLRVVRQDALSAEASASPVSL